MCGLETHGVEAQVSQQGLHEDLCQVCVGVAAGRAIGRVRGEAETEARRRETLRGVGGRAVAQQRGHMCVVL